ncbi:lactate utilization protein C [Bacillus sp. V5-8f]|uniref:LutC/YkgG family protein n=1 Tax=Bacillus sp. V5-8f TaxID=2053044 RepID=UPI000C786141|nr:lactate utilization protein C [Bacillus sp. V5-8f]PLT32791.1 lactate utilization protein C [Bacillus sp. V5-8f]
MQGTIQNREAFLNNIASRLGRERLSKPVPSRAWQYRPQDEVLQGATTDELVEVLKTHCLKIHTSLVITDLKNLPGTLEKTVADYGNESIVTWKDQRYSDWGLDPLLKDTLPRQNIDVYEWDYKKGDENIRQAEKANIGITISEITLAESGTVVLFSDKDKGRTVSFLPKTIICLIPKSSIVPRMTQAARIIREKHLSGNQVPSCINFITGPSNSADIELNLVVGVHGPVKATYILIDDL